MNILHYSFALCFVTLTATAEMPPLYPHEDCSSLETQTDMNICACSNRDSADQVLNDTYKRVMNLITNQKAKTDLRIAQRKWIKMRDKTCNKKVGPREESGSIWDMQMCTCQEEITATRIRELNKKYPATIDQLD